MSKSYLVDVRHLEQTEKREVYNYLNRFAFFVDEIFAFGLSSGISGYHVPCTHDCRTELENIPHNCDYKDVTTWDLASDKNAINYAFQRAFYQ